MRFLFLLIILILSCAEPDEVYDMDMSVITEFESKNSIAVKNDTWICHNPNTEFHNEVCIENEYPLGCFVRGDLHKFCWLLKTEDCLSPRQSLIEPCENAGYSIND